MRKILILSGCLFLALVFSIGCVSASTDISIDEEKQKFLRNLYAGGQQGYLPDCFVGIGSDYVSMVRTMGRPEGIDDSYTTYTYGDVKLSFIYHDGGNKVINQIESRWIKDYNITESDIHHVFGKNELLEYALGNYKLSFYIIDEKAEAVILS